MADYTVRDESQHWRVIAVPVPNFGAELYKAMNRAEQEYERVHGRKANADDAFEIDTNDEEIIIRFEVRKEVS